MARMASTPTQITGDTINIDVCGALLTGELIRYVGANAQIRITVPPVRGSWKVGDKVTGRVVR